MIYEGCMEEYIRYLGAKGYAEGTIIWRRAHLKIFFDYLQQLRISDFRELMPEHIESYKVYLKEEYRSVFGKKVSESTYRHKLVTVRCFFNWLEQTGQILMSPVVKDARAKKPKGLRLPNVLTEEEVLSVLEASIPNTAIGLRDRAMMELFYATGIRLSEMVNLNVDDFDVKEQELRIVEGKGKKDRVVPVGEYASKYTEMYLKMIRPWMVKGKEEKALFVKSTTGERLGKTGLAAIVKNVVRKSGVKKRATAHTFRHSMATHLLRNKADLRHIQAILGHSSIVTTEIYTHLAKEDLKKMVETSHPHSKRS